MKHIYSRIATLAVVVSVAAFPLATFAVSPAPTVMEKQESDEVPNAARKIISQYVLPYPGILPDHPLYFLKQLRDQILDRLIIDPVRKAEFYILQGDKRLNMGIFLTEKGKAALAVQTIGQGEGFMKKAVNGLVAAKAGGREIPASIVDRLTQSLGKHQEVLEEMLATATEGEIASLTQSLAEVKKLQEGLVDLQ